MGLRLRLYCENDDRIAIASFRDGLSSYEPETLQLFLRLLDHSATVVDIGANTGVFSLLAAIHNRQRAVYAFEPVPKIYQRLVQNSRLNETANLTATQTALSDSDGKVTLHVPAGDLLPTEASTISEFRKDTVAVEVETRRLDSFVEERGVEQVDLIKIDTEGTEHKVFAGARDVIKRWRPIIFCEVLRAMTEDLLHAELDAVGYSYFWITKRGLVHKERIEGDPNYEDLNYLFVPHERVGFVQGVAAGLELAASGLLS